MALGPSLLPVFLACFLSPVALTASPPDWEKDFLKPVDDPIQVDFVPSHLRNMMLLAVERMYNPEIKEDDPMLNPTIREQLRAQGFSIDGSFAGASPVDRGRMENMQRIRKAHRSETVPLADDFEPGFPDFWEKVLGGMVSGACGSVQGEALCFDDEGQRAVIAAPLRIIGGAVARFALWMSVTEEESDVTLEYQVAGSQSWEAIGSFNSRTYSLPSPSNPNTKWLDSGGGSEHNGFVFFAVPVPRAADSGATKLRWIQYDSTADGSQPGTRVPAKWALDNIEVELGLVERPAVILTVSQEIAGEGLAAGSWLNVMAQFSEPVIAFDRLKIQAEGGVVASVSKVTGIAAGMGDMYTIGIVPSEGANDVTVQMLEGAGITKKGVKSMASNSIVVLVDHGAEDSVVSRVAKVSSSVIDLDATGMAEPSPVDDAAEHGCSAGQHDAVKELQERVKYLEREVRRLQVMEADLQYLKAALLRTS